MIEMKDTDVFTYIELFLPLNLKSRRQRVAAGAVEADTPQICKFVSTLGAITIAIVAPMRKSKSKPQLSDIKIITK